MSYSLLHTKVREAMRAGGLEVDVAARKRGLLGPLMEGRREYLEAAGMLAPGVRVEEVLVVRGRNQGSTADGSSHHASRLAPMRRE